MEKKQAQWAEKKASGYFRDGYNCAESIVRTANNVIDPDLVSTPGIATGFGRGMGGTDEACGALTGGVIVLGALFGREDSRGSERRALRATREYRKLFKDKFGATSCRDLLKKYHGQMDFRKCRKMTGEAAGVLVEVIDKYDPDVFSQ